MSDTAVRPAASERASAAPGLRVSADFDRIMAGVAELAPMMRADGQRGEVLGRPTPAVLEALEDLGVYRAMMPREVGGFEFSPTQQIQLMEALAWHESGTAWTVLGVVDVSALCAAYLDDVAVEEYFGDGRCALMSGQGTRPGTGVRVDGGYLVSGQWQFNSGSAISTHIHTAILGDDGRMLMATMPVEQVEYIDNWNVLGLRASASNDYRIDGVFVADTHTYDPVTPIQRRGGAMFQAGLAYLASMQHAGWALGVSKRLLEEVRAQSAQKAARPGAATSTDQFYAAYAEMEARYRGARAFLLQAWGDVERTVDAGEPLSTEQISLIQLGTITTNRTAQFIANEVATFAGTALIRESALQRYFRDVYTGVSHLVCSPPLQQEIGRQLAGRAAADARWEFYDLVEPEAAGA